MSARQHLLSDDDVADLLAEIDALKDWVRDLIQQRNDHLRLIAGFRRQLAQRPAHTSLIDPDAAEL